MKRHGNLWDKIIDEENLSEAYRKARKHKSNFRSVKKFELDEEGNLKKVRQSLLDKTFTTSPYTSKIIYEPKKRVIYALPFSPDRIVQHALMNVLAPIFDRLFIDNSFACREGKGQHSGSAKTREYIKKNKYCLKGDISKFYPSINHEILLKIIKRKIKCQDTLWLIENIVNSFPGETNAPIGNLTSQWFGNLYMNELDTYVKQELKIKDYLRYCDDFCLFHDDKKVLNEAAVKIEDFVKNELNLKLSKCDLFPVSRGVDFLGYRHFTRYTLLRKRTAKRVKKRIKALPAKLERGVITKEQYRSSLASTYGWLKWADTYNLRMKLEIDTMLETAKAK
jgi:RNA-directed DNA polymerase